MGLQRVLNHLHALQDRVPMRFWGDDKRDTSVAPHACGYCAKGRTCTHEAVRRGALKPLVSRRSETSLQRLSELLADVDRQITKLGPAAMLFRLRYQVRVPDHFPDGRPTFRQHTDAEVMGLLKIRNRSDYMRAHNLNLAEMECRLIDWFERDATGAAPVDELLEEAMTELQEALAA